MLHWQRAHARPQNVYCKLVQHVLTVVHPDHGHPLKRSSLCV